MTRMYAWQEGMLNLIKLMPHRGGGGIEILTVKHFRQRLIDRPEDF